MPQGFKIDTVKDFQNRKSWCHENKFGLYRIKNYIII